MRLTDKYHGGVPMDRLPPAPRRERQNSEPWGWGMKLLAAVMAWVRQPWTYGIWWLDKRQCARQRQLECQVVGGHGFRSAANASMAALALAVGATMMGEWDLGSGGQTVANAAVFNVVDEPFNADPTGTNVSTTGIQLADTTAATSPGGGYVYFPPGIYLTNSLTWSPGAVWLGVNSQAYYGAAGNENGVPNPATQSQLLLVNTSTTPLLSPNDTGAKLAVSARIRDLALNCNGVGVAGGVGTGAGAGIDIPDTVTSTARFLILERAYIFNVGSATRGYAMNIGQNNTGCTLRNVTMFNESATGTAGGTNGLRWYGPDGTSDATFIGGFAGDGLDVEGGTADITLTWWGGGVFGNGTGATIAGTGATFIGTSFDHNQDDGVFIGQAGSITAFFGCNFHNNSLSGSGNNSHIHVGANNCTVFTVGSRAGQSTTPNCKYFFFVGAFTGTVWDWGGQNEGETFTIAWTNYTGATTTPSFPATTVAVTNTTGGKVQAFIVNGAGAITQVTINGIATGSGILATTSESFIIPNGGTISFTYASGTPTWTWVITA